MGAITNKTSSPSAPSSGGNTNLMASAMLAKALSSAGGAYAQSRALKARGNYEAGIDDENAGFAKMQAADAINRGEYNAQLYLRKAAAAREQQRTGYAAQGVDVNSGSAAKVQSETAGMGAVDAQMIRNNAWREAFGYNVQALDYSSRGKFAKLSSDEASGNTILTGGMNFAGAATEAGYWYSKS